MNKRKYKNPALIETVFELRFPSNKEWSLATFVNFANKAKDAGYPDVVEGTPGFQFDFPVDQSDQPKMKPVARRIQAWNKDKTALLQAGTEIFAANRRVPYLGWDNFLPSILDGFAIYSKIANPKKAERLSLNYINRIEFGPNDPPDNYINFLPPGIKYADHIQAFGCQTEQSFRDGDIIVVSAARDLAPQTFAVILNIVYVKKLPTLALKGLKASIETAHSRLIEAFEATITDQQRERMKQI